jgi:hypothetical protein
VFCHPSIGKPKKTSVMERHPASVGTKIHRTRGPNVQLRGTQKWALDHFIEKQGHCSIERLRGREIERQARSGIDHRRLGEIDYRRSREILEPRADEPGQPPKLREVKEISGN